MKRLVALLLSVAAVAAATGLIYALRPVAPDLSLGVVYVLPVMLVAIAYGMAYASGVALASVLAFNFLFLPPLYSFTLRDGENWIVLAVYVGTAVVVGILARSAKNRAADAHQREREATLIADAARMLLRSQHVQDEIGAIAGRTASVLRAGHARVEVGSLRRPEPDEVAYDLDAGDRRVGRIFFTTGQEPDTDVRERVLPALASLLAVAEDREKLALKALETESLRRSDAVKTAVIRSVSHDFRSPLTAVRAAVDGLLSASIQLDEHDRHDLLETIDVESRRLERLVHNLLDLSRIQAGAAEPRLEVWTADGIIGRALDAIGADADRVDVDLAEDPPAFRVDGAQVERALVNLLENALKFSSPADRVRVSAAVADGETVIRVSDSGPGLTQAEQDRIFDPFDRGTAGSGTGLGLSIVRGFAEANDGRVWVESEPGRGSSFVLGFPAAGQQAVVRQ
jgi:two-component system, OmpR family, sensor histidine kinase KdpD